ncbi:hypothetical protein QSJ18_18385 [Gordonia sp. ABSL1-1]|uniref:hypothetical protein n=1 Tax=Gordonia sp. ABSL1-1 TaxID=3053923 RepID=UPI0025729DD6|nr:hypothetical protein [Gordonia sp. ABSL1-1]MDL9938719.1 hypothetical protein [Gordonia sp. ABSL1-1]
MSIGRKLTELADELHPLSLPWVRRQLRGGKLDGIGTFVGGNGRGYWVLSDDDIAEIAVRLHRPAPVDLDSPTGLGPRSKTLQKMRRAS